MNPLEGVEARHGLLSLAQGVATIVIAASMLWMGSLVTELTNRLTSLETTLLTSTKIVALERKVELSELEAELLILTGSSKAMGREVEDMKGWFMRLFPRVRQHGENIEMIHHAVVREHPDMRLELGEPEIPGE